MLSRTSLLFSLALCAINVSFLFAIVKYKTVIAVIIFPGLTIGILGFLGVIVAAVVLTWLYVAIINRSDLTR